MSSQLQTKQKHLVNFLWIGLFFSSVYWILESVRDVVTFGKGTLIERLIFPDSVSLWMRVVVICIIMAFSAIIQRIRQKAESEHQSNDFLAKGSVIVLSLFFGIGYWVLEAIRDVLVYNRGTLIQQIFAPDPVAFWMRLMAIFILVLFGVYVKTITEQQRKTEEMLKKLQSTQARDLEVKIAEMESIKANFEKEIQSKEWEEKELRELIRKKDSSLRSIHQVIRTNLQQLNSLLDLRTIQSMDNEKKSIYTEMRTLIYSLIVLHTFLNKSAYSDQIILSDYIKGIMDYLYHSYQVDEIKIHVDNAHIIVPISQAVSVAFAMCEIVFLAKKKRELHSVSDPFQVLIKRTNDSALTIKIRHKDQNTLSDIENENSPPEYQWLKELIDQHLHGDFWVVRNSQGIDMNIVFKLKI